MDLKPNLHRIFCSVWALWLLPRQHICMTTYKTSLFSVSRGPLGKVLGDLKNIPPIAMETYDAMSTLLIIYGNFVLPFSAVIFGFLLCPAHLSSPLHPPHPSSPLSSPLHPLYSSSLFSTSPFQFLLSSHLSTLHSSSPLLFSPIPFSHLSIPRLSMPPLSFCSLLFTSLISPLIAPFPLSPPLLLSLLSSLNSSSPLHLFHDTASSPSDSSP